MNTSRNRKIVYIVGIVLIMTVNTQLSAWIDGVAAKRKLQQSNLGKINPVSGIAQLALFGFRGVAVTFLWQEANDLKREERWFEIRPVLESITLLQPHFSSPWQFQAWNMAYNIAAEWEAVPDKYYWIRQGVDFMKSACETNSEQPDMLWYVGWMYYNRFNMADEKHYLRELFWRNRNSKKVDDEKFARGRNGGYDNNDVAFDWFSDANAVIVDKQVRPKRMGSGPFMSYPAHSRGQFAIFMSEGNSETKEAAFGAKARDAWRSTHEEWLKFGRRGNANPDRFQDYIFRLEYTPEEFSKLNDEQKYWADRYAKVVNYNYWKKRSKREATDDMQAAREALYFGTKHRRLGNFDLAVKNYEKAFSLWLEILKTDDNLKNDDLIRDELIEHEHHFLKMLEKLDSPKYPLPKFRPFEDLYPAYNPFDTPTAISGDLSKTQGLGIAPPSAKELKPGDKPSSAPAPKTGEPKK